jgi:hypothetical protein
MLRNWQHRRHECPPNQQHLSTIRVLSLICSLKGGPRTSALPRRFPADPPVLQGNDSLCHSNSSSDIRGGIRLSASCESPIAVFDCHASSQDLVRLPARPGLFVFSVRAARSASALPPPARTTNSLLRRLFVSPSARLYIRALSAGAMPERKGERGR